MKDIKVVTALLLEIQKDFVVKYIEKEKFLLKNVIGFLI